jgi:hypothetical protein
MTCTELADAAPQLALRVLPGDERGRALHHLEGCAVCRELVASLTAVNDALVAAAPSAEPPAGFEERVLARFDARPADTATAGGAVGAVGTVGAVGAPARGPAGPSTGVGRRRPGRRGLGVRGGGVAGDVRDGGGAGRAVGRRGVAAGVALAFAAALVAVAVADPFEGGDADPVVAVVEMRTASGTVVGEARLEADDPPMLFLSLPGWIESIAVYGSEGESYAVLVEYRGGSEARLELRATSESWWGIELPRGDVDRVAAVAIVDTVGRVWCRGTFS